jgi:hypothetical protein
VLAVLERLSGVPRPRLQSSPGLLRTASRVMALVDRVHGLKGTLSPETLRVGAGATYLASNADVPWVEDESFFPFSPVSSYSW